MFKKNSMEFFIGLDSYLYYFLQQLYYQSIITCSPRIFCDHLTLSHDLSSHTIYISTPLYILRFWIKCLGNYSPFGVLITLIQVCYLLSFTLMVFYNQPRGCQFNSLVCYSINTYLWSQSRRLMTHTIAISQELRNFF